MLFKCAEELMIQDTLATKMAGGVTGPWL